MREPATYEKSVLLIEDDPDTRHISGTVLRHGGYRVLETADGGEGILLAQRHRPDVISGPVCSARSPGS